MTAVIVGQCISAGSILLESDIVSAEIPTFEQYYSGGHVFVLASVETLVFPNVKERQIPAAPFDSPCIVPLYSHASVPAQPRRTVFIQDLGDRRLSLEASIPIALDFWTDSVTACCYDLEDFGVGQDEFSALADLKASLVELYFLLKAEAGRLGPLPQRHWDYLRAIVREN